MSEVVNKLRATANSSRYIQCAVLRSDPTKTVYFKPLDYSKEDTTGFRFGSNVNGTSFGHLRLLINETLFRYYG